MFYRFRRAAAMRWFTWQCRGILSTPSITCKPGSVQLVSMLAHPDVLMYLLAVKSFYPRLGEGSVTVIDDGSLTAADRALLEHHVRGLTFEHISRIDTGPLPRGGTWERLIHILELSRDSYVIQLDCDTIAQNPIDDVIACWRENRAFLLGTGMGREIVTAGEAAVFARGLDSTHVQVAAEREFDRVPLRPGLHYVRASSGFAGFPRGGCDAGLLREFSAAMAAKLGTRWNEWGTEQVSSNFVLANADGARVLPYPRYVCFSPSIPWREAAFLHFIGTNRFDDGVYADAGRRVIAGLTP